MTPQEEAEIRAQVTDLPTLLQLSIFDLAEALLEIRRAINDGRLVMPLEYQAQAYAGYVAMTATLRETLAEIDLPAGGEQASDPDPDPEPESPVSYRFSPATISIN